MSAICFDLEGPLSPQDNAFEVMGLFENGRRIFEIISKYDDILTLERRSNYEPGDTLKLIIPFLLYHGVRDADVREVSDRAKLVEGAEKTVGQLVKGGWEVYIISTSYAQHAESIGARLGLDAGSVYCTRIRLDECRKYLEEDELSLIAEFERKMLKLKEGSEIRDSLDSFYNKELAGSRIGHLLDGIAVCGGENKANAVADIVKKSTSYVDEVIAVGDSITDYKMLRMVREAGGLSIVFNGNEYALPYGSVGVASITLGSILEIAEAFRLGGKDRVREAVLSSKNDDQACFHWLEGAGKEDMTEIAKVHMKFRQKVRGSAAKLG